MRLQFMFQWFTPSGELQSLSAGTDSMERRTRNMEIRIREPPLLAKQSHDRDRLREEDHTFLPNILKLNGGQI